jgi:hypothetical protein
VKAGGKQSLLLHTGLLLGIISQKIELFITTDVRTSNPTSLILFLKNEKGILAHNTNH